MQIHRFLLLLPGLLLLAGTAAADPVPAPAPPPPPADLMEPPPPPPPGREKPKKEGGPRFGGPRMWRVFANLSEKERQELLRLQSSDPEKFRSVLKEKAEAMRQVELARRQEFRRLVAAYHAASSSTEKESIKAKLSSHLRTDFEQRLNENRRQLEEMKRRAIRLEAELNKRAENTEKIVAAMVEHAITRQEK